MEHWARTRFTIILFTELVDSTTFMQRVRSQAG
jgi:hypothetical protein